MRFFLIRLNIFLVLSSRVSIILLNVSLIEHLKRHILMYEKNKSMKKNMCREDTQKRDYYQMRANCFTEKSILIEISFIRNKPTLGRFKSYLNEYLQLS